jgi:hypothetical protein
MVKATLIVGLAVLGLGVAVGWQVASSEWANLELRDDLRDVAAQNSSKIGLNPPRSNDDLRNEVIRAANEHGIRLQPGQVTAERSGTADFPTAFLAVDYEVFVKLAAFSFTLHFNPSSAR